MRQGTKWIGAFTLAALVAAVSGCAHDVPILPGHHDLAPVGRLVLSDTAVGAANAAALGAVAGEVTFVSLPSESIANGEFAMITNQRTGTAAAAAFVNGGFDPIGIVAAPGDTLETIVTLRDVGQALHFSNVVPNRRQPRVIRTIPARGKRDVPLNTRITIVFSEPVDRQRLTSVSVRLTKGGTSVPAQIEVIDADGLMADVIPLVPLDPETSYEVLVNQNVRDLDGDVLETNFATDFTTGLPPGAVQVFIDPVGDVFDADGYRVRLLGNELDATLGARSRDSVVWRSVTPGQYTVTVEGVADECALDGDATRSLAVVGEATTTLTFTVTCVAPAFTGVLAFVAMVETAMNIFNSEIFSANADGTGLTNLTNSPGVGEEEPVWSPDGQRIAFVSDRSGTPEIHVMNADGSNVVQLTFGNLSLSHGFSEYSSFSPTWSPDGTRIAYSTISDGSLNLWVVGAEASGAQPTLLFSGPGWDGQPAWSPDGNRIALMSDRNAYDKVQDIYLINADGSGLTALTGNASDSTNFLWPVWSPDGSKLAVTIVDRTHFGLELATHRTYIGLLNADGSGLTSLVRACGTVDCRTRYGEGAYSGWGTRSSWSPDGNVIAFSSRWTDGLMNVSWVKADGSLSGTLFKDARSPAWRP